MKRMIYIFLAIIMMFSLTACSGEGGTTADVDIAPVDSISTVTPEESLTASVADSPSAEASPTAEAVVYHENWIDGIYFDGDPNTSSMVDTIMLQAASDAQTFSEAHFSDAAYLIKTLYPDFYLDNKTMETAMYCGYLLEYAYDSNDDMLLYAKLGIDTYQAIKYVYRGVEAIDDEATQINLSSIEEILHEIYGNEFQMPGLDATFETLLAWPDEDEAVAAINLEGYEAEAADEISIEMTISSGYGEEAFANIVKKYTDAVLAVCVENGIICRKLAIDVPLEDDSPSIFPTCITWAAAQPAYGERVNDNILIGSVYDDRYNAYIHDIPYDAADAAFASETYLLAVQESLIEWYSGGTYKVGEDIPAGEYIVEKNAGRSSVYICVSTASSGEIGDIIFNENSGGYYFINISDGQYFEVSGGQFALASTVPVSFDSSELGEGLYRVGIDIPAGEYKCTKNDSDRSHGYFCVYSANSGDFPIINNDNFENSTYVTVSEGTYLYLSGCSASLCD